jgi:hypothetical protein
MPLTNGCFFSYRRRPGNDVYNKFVEGFFKTLRDELDAIGVQIFRDDPSLEEGQLLEQTIWPELCQSACLVVVYTQDYFNRRQLWCAREFMGMSNLEQQRLPLLNDAKEQTYGLIIIVVFRGEETLSKTIKNRLYYNFSEYTLSATNIPENPVYAPEIQKMAGYIYRRLDSLGQLSPDLSGDCPKRRLPTEIEAGDWLDQITSKTPATEVKQQETPDGPVSKLPFH